MEQKQELTRTERESMVRVLEVLEDERLATSGTAIAVLWDDLYDALMNDEAEPLLVA